MWRISRINALCGAAEISVGMGMVSSCLCSHDAVLWIFVVFGEGASGDIMDKVRKRILSRISAAAALRYRDSRICWNVVADAIRGHCNASE